MRGRTVAGRHVSILSGRNAAGRPQFGCNGTRQAEDLAMKLYFLALATLLIVCVGCVSDGQQFAHRQEYHAPPAQMMTQPGPMVGGPGPGVMGMWGMGAAAYAAPPVAETRTSQVRFLGPEGMNVGWQIGSGFAEN